MFGSNLVIILGTVGQDPVYKTFSNGGSTLSFSVATNMAWIDKATGQKVEKTEWHRIVLNNSRAVYANRHLRKGHKIHIQGSLRTRRWTDTNNIEHFITEIIGNEITLFEFVPKEQAQSQVSSKPIQQSFLSNDTIIEDFDLPF